MINVFVVFIIILISFIIFRLHLLLDPFNFIDDIELDITSQSCELIDLSANIFPLGNSEDMEVLNDRILILSNFPYDDIAKNNYTNQNFKYYPLVVFNIKDKVATPMEIVGFPSGKELRSHGISIDKNSLTLSVVNHAIGEGESRVEIFRMELFQLDPDAVADDRCDARGDAYASSCSLVSGATLDSAVSVVAHHIGSTTGFHTGSVNDVVLVGNNTMYITEFTKAVLPPGAASPTAVGAVVQEVSMLLGAAIFSIQKCTAPRHQHQHHPINSHSNSNSNLIVQWKCISLISLPPLNGISVTNDRSVLVVVSPGLKSLLLYSTHNPHVLVPVMKSRLPFMVDNIVLAVDECGLNSYGEYVDVWYGAGILRGLDYLLYRHGVSTDIPSGQLRIEFNRHTRTITYNVMRRSMMGCFSVSAKLPNSSHVSGGDHNPSHSGPTAVGSFCASGIYLCN